MSPPSPHTRQYKTLRIRLGFVIGTNNKHAIKTNVTPSDYVTNPDLNFTHKTKELQTLNSLECLLVVDENPTTKPLPFKKLKDAKNNPHSQKSLHTQP